MSLVNLSHFCSALQNACQVRLGKTAFPMTKLHLKLSLALQRQGFVSSVELGSKRAPPPPEPISPQEQRLLADRLALQPWDAYPNPKFNSMPDRDPPFVPKNPADQRLWLGMKYWNSEPVLTKCQMVSKPSRRIFLTPKEVARVARGFRAGYVPGLVKPGECMFLLINGQVYEAREALEKSLGGLALCRTW